MTEVISYCTESRRSVVHSLHEAMIVPVDHSKLLGSPLLASEVSRFLSDRTEKLKLANDRLTNVTAVLHHYMSLTCCIHRPSYIHRPSHSRNTRPSTYNMPLLNRPAHSKATLGDCSFSLASSSVWNSILCHDVRCAPSMLSLKSCL